MSSRSIPGAIIEKVGTFTYTGKPTTIWFGEAPLKDTSGTAVQLPIVEFFQEGQGTTPVTFEYIPFMNEVVYRFEVWARTLESCTDQVLGLLFNGGANNGGAGLFNGGTLTFAANSYTFKALEFVGEFPAFFEGKIDPRDENANRVYHGVFRIKVKAEWTGT